MADATTVVIVERDPARRETLSALLRRKGCTVLTFASAVAALACLREQAAAVMPVDVKRADDLSLDQAERRHIQAILEGTRGNISHAARILGIDRVTLYNKIRKYALREAAGRPIKG